MKLYLLIFAISFTLSCQEQDNFAECVEEKKDIAEVTSLEEMLEIEAKEPSSTCTMLTYEEDAQKYIKLAAETSSAAGKKENYTKASNILVKLVEFYPEDYNRYGVLAATYAGAGGVELVQFLQQISSSGTGSIFDSGKDTLPSPEDDGYESVKDNLSSATEWIDEKIDQEALEVIPQIDTLQSTVYRMAQTLVIANGFLSKTDSGEWDQESIENLSPDDVDAIMDNLGVIADQIPDPKAKAKMEEFSGSDELTDEEKKELLKQALAN